MSMVTMKTTVLFFVPLTRISFHPLGPLQGWIVFDLHLHLIKQSIQGSIVGVSSWRRPYFLAVMIHFLPYLGFLWTRTLFWMVYIVILQLFTFFLLFGNNCVLCIYKTLGKMYQLSYRLRILVVQLMNEQVWTNSIVECYQENLVIHLIHQQSFSIKMADKST